MAYLPLSLLPLSTVDHHRCPPLSSLLETLQDRLRLLIEGVPAENWAYAIFWQHCHDHYSRMSVLGWGDGYYQGDENENKAMQYSTSSSSSPAEQKHRKKVLQELYSVILGSAAAENDAEDAEEDVSDTQWFFLLSMTATFVDGAGFPGQAFLSGSPVWLTGPERLAGSTCRRSRQAQAFGLQTLVFIPTKNGVIELGSIGLVPPSCNFMMSRVMGLFELTNGVSTSLELGLSVPTGARAEADQEEKENGAAPPSGFTCDGNKKARSSSSGAGGSKSNYWVSREISRMFQIQPLGYEFFS